MVQKSTDHSQGISHILESIFVVQENLQMRHQIIQSVQVILVTLIVGRKHMSKIGNLDPHRVGALQFRIVHNNHRRRVEMISELLLEPALDRLEFGDCVGDCADLGGSVRVRMMELVE